MPRKLTENITLYSRWDWGAKKPTRPMSRHSGVLRESFLHHTTDRLAEHFTTLADQKAAMRGIQRFHQVSNGWSDIGYSFLIFQAYGKIPHARIFEGRSTAFIPAAQLNHNDRTLPISVVGNFQGDDEVMRNTRHAIKVLLDEFPTLVTLGGHRDVVGTACPGDTLYRQIPTIARAANLKVFKR